MQLPTALEGVVLQGLLPDDAASIVALLRSNRDHLTRNGDFGDEVMVAEPELRLRYAQNTEPPLAFAILENDQTVGAITLVAVDPPRYGLGYWVAESAAGRGLATAAVAAMVDHARTLGASDVFAGVTHGNQPSITVLRRNGFETAEDFATYTRFHRAVRTPGDRGSV